MVLWKPAGGSETSVGAGGGFKGLHEDLSPAARPLGILSRMSNLRINPAPALSTRPGLALLGTAGAARINGLHVYRKLDGTTQLLRHVGTALEKWTGAAWSSVATGLPDTASTSANLNDYLCLFTGTNRYKWNGASLTTLAGAPQAKFVVEAYEQLFVCGIPGRDNDLDFCDVALPETWSPAPTNDAGSISMSAHPTRWVDYDRIQGKVIVWTSNTVEMLLGPETSNRPALWAVRTVASEGTQNGRTVQNLNGAWIWLADDAFVIMAGGITKVYEPIKTSFALIDWANITKAQAWVTQEGEYVCQVPKTGGGTIWFTYSPGSGWLTDTGADLRASCMMDFAGRMYTVLGDASGAVTQVGGTTDAGTAISWSVELGPTVLGNVFENKQLLAVEVAMLLGAGATASGALSNVETGDVWSATQTVTAGATMQKARLVVPKPPGWNDRSGVFRLKLWGTGQVTIHDVRIRFA